MAHPYPVDTAVTAGMKRDFNRAAMPGGSAWNLIDVIPDQLGAPLRGRGGFSYGDSGVMGSTTAVDALCYAPFSTAKLLAITSDGHLWRIDSGPTDIGSVSGTHYQNPIFYRGKVIIPIDGAGPSSYDGTTLGSLAGTPPACRYAGSFSDHAYLAYANAATQRIYFSAAGDPTSWNTSSGYVDADGGAITGVVALRNMILVFHDDSTDRFRGSIPPPGTDFVQDKRFFSFGCMDAYSIATWNDRAIFANSQGVFMTDGAGWTDLTARAGMSTYYQTQVASYSKSWRLAGYIYRNHYFLSINNGTTVVDTLVFNLSSGAMWRFSNFHAASGVQVVTGAAEECYIGLTNAGRVGKISSCWKPAVGVKNDADGVGLTPTFETVAHQGYDRLHRRWIPSAGAQRWKYLYATYNLTDYASDNPVLNVSYVTTPDATSYTSIATTLAETTATTRKRLQITTGNLSNSLALKITQTNPGDLRLYDLSLVYDPLEIGALRG